MDEHRPRVLFVCVKNGGKSQLAAALMTRLAEDSISVRSAGTKPGATINQLAAESLAEIGIDLSHAEPKAITPEAVTDADLVVTLGSEAHVDRVDGTEFENWDIDEPSERGIDGLERMRLVRDDIARHVEELHRRLIARSPPARA